MWFWAIEINLTWHCLHLDLEQQQLILSPSLAFDYYLIHSQYSPKKYATFQLRSNIKNYTLARYGIKETPVSIFSRHKSSRPHLLWTSPQFAHRFKQTQNNSWTASCLHQAFGSFWLRLRRSQCQGSLKVCDAGDDSRSRASPFRLISAQIGLTWISAALQHTWLKLWWAHTVENVTCKRIFNRHVQYVL